MINIKNKIINKNANIIFINSKSYNKFYKNQQEIKKLKYNCGNNHITHYIQYDDFVLRISTHYKHQPKTNGISEHINEIVYDAKHAKENIKGIVEEQIKRIQTWKKNIDNIPDDLSNNKIVSSKENIGINKKIINKIKKFFLR